MYQNKLNKSKYKNNTSGHTGVFWNKFRNRWCAKIIINKKSIQLGSFKDIESAIQCYETGAKKYFGEFANLNFPKNYKLI